MAKGLSKIYIIGILAVVLAVGFFAWQKFGASQKTYKNESYGFEIKYLPAFEFSSTGPNSEQQKLERGETISGTVQPSYDTIIFSSRDDKEQFRMEIFHPHEKAISAENYRDGYLYLYGSCDLRWGFEPTVAQMMKNSSVEILGIKGKFLGPSMKTPTFGGCYYFKNYSNNLIVISTDFFENQLDFEKVDSMASNILLTLNLFSQKPEVSNNVPHITIISPNGGEKWVSGGVYNITWTSQGVDKVKITLINYGYYVGEEDSTVPLSYEMASDISADLRKYEKYIHPNIKIGDKYKIKIESCSGDKCYSDESNNYFSIN